MGGFAHRKSADSTTLQLPLLPPVSREVMQERAENHPHPFRRKCSAQLLKALDAGEPPITEVPQEIGTVVFGDNQLLLIALSGEAVVDYSLKLKAAHGWENTWVMAYTQLVPTYIPSAKVIEEGYYEGYDAIIIKGAWNTFDPAIEPMILNEVKTLLKNLNWQDPVIHAGELARR